MSEWALVVAIVRCDRLPAVEEALLRAGAAGFSCSPVRGTGEYRDFFRADATCEHMRVEVFCRRREAERIAGAIVGAAHTGLAGDGLVAVVPVAGLWRVRECAAFGDGG